MSTPRIPNRPTQQQIFRRRRALALVVIVILVWALVAAISSLFNASGAVTPTQSSPVVTAQSGQPCVPGTVLVTAFIGDGTKSQVSFDTDVKPLIWFTLTNTGKVDCTFSAGSRVQFFTITSGAETIWSSKDCDRSKDVDYTASLKPNVAQTSPAQTWSRVHSAGSGAGSGCGVGQPAVTAGGASYHLKAEVGGVISAKDVQFVLN